MTDLESRARTALKNGVAGFVCQPQEILKLIEELRTCQKERDLARAGFASIYDEYLGKKTSFSDRFLKEKK